MRKITFALAFFALLASVPLFADGLDQNLLERLKNEGCPALRARGKLPDKFHLKWIHAKKHISFEEDFYSDGKYFILKIKELPREGDTSIYSQYYVKNKSYYFCVVRNDDHPWEMGGCSRLDRSDYPYALEAVQENSPYMLGSRSLAEYIENPDFEITKIESTFSEGIETIRFEIENRSKNRSGDTDSVKNGTISLLPSKDWGISEMTIDFESDGCPMRRETHFRYGDEPNTFCPIKELRGREIRLPDGQSEGYAISYNHVILECDGAECPRAEFFPKFYGLRKPCLLLPPGYYLRYALGAIGLALIFTALLSKWRKRRAGKIGAERSDRRVPDEES
ncbi:MAG: hypothetical protein IKE69_03535 [Thermoguttaceae bacterium]|nr:hypothetical protein [Thermoguttaceae bacterium]